LRIQRWLSKAPEIASVRVVKKSAIIALAAFFLFVWVVGWSSVALYLWHLNSIEAVGTADVSSFKIRFGIVQNDGSNHFTVTQETTTIPMRFGDSSYGFQVIPPDEGTYSVYFISHFPYPPKTISGDVFESNTPSTDMRSVTAQMQGEYVQDMGFDPGDPAGDQSIDIWINGKLAKTIIFTVTPAADDQK
jgi:hypothetical protein